MQTQLYLMNTQLELMETMPLVLDLTLPPTSLKPSITCPSTPPLDSRPTVLPSKPKKLSMRFHSPMKQSLGMRTASAWHWEQILEAHQKLDLHNRNRLSKGMIPVQSPLTTMTTSASVLSAPANEPTVTANLTPRLRRHHPYLSPLEPHHQCVKQIELNREQAEALVTQLVASLNTHCEDPTEIQGEREPPPEYPAGSRGVEPELAAQGVEVLDIPVGGCQN
jgi:hypothetical protein